MSYKIQNRMFKYTYGLSGNEFRATTLSKLYLMLKESSYQVWYW